MRLEHIFAAILTLSSPTLAQNEVPDPQYVADFGSGAMGDAAAGMGTDNDTARAAERPELTPAHKYPNWVTRHQKDDKWGYTLYRTYYPPDDPDNATWNVVFATLTSLVNSALAEDANWDGDDRDPYRVRDRLAFDIVADEANLSGADYETVRAHFQAYVRDEYNGTKMGGFQYGGYLKLRLPGYPSDGMALNQALVIDEGAWDSLLGYTPDKEQYALAEGEEPPHVVAVDMCFSPDGMVLTSWTEQYEGWYLVPAKLLMLDFFDMVYEARPMEHFAPNPSAPINMFGISYAVDDEEVVPLTEEEYMAEAGRAREALLGGDQQVVE